MLLGNNGNPSAQQGMHELYLKGVQGKDKSPQRDQFQTNRCYVLGILQWRNVKHVHGKWGFIIFYKECAIMKGIAQVGTTIYLHVVTTKITVEYLNFVAQTKSIKELWS